MKEKNRDKQKNSSYPEIRVKRVWVNEFQLYDPFFWQFEEKITEVLQNFCCRETKTVISSPNGPLLINTPSLSKHRFMPSGQLPVVN